MSDSFTDINGNKPQVFFQDFYASYDAFDVPAWLRILAYIVVAHGLVELLLYTILSMGYPVKKALGRTSTKVKVMAGLFCLVVFYVRAMYFLLAFNLLPPSPEQRESGEFFILPSTLAVQVFWVVILSYFIFGTFPVITGIIGLLRQRIWRTTPAILYSPHVTVIIPIYNESLSTLVDTIESVLKSKYSGAISIYCAFDDDKETDIVKSLKHHFASSPVHFLLFPHGGKRQTQGRAWDIVQHREIHLEHAILLLDSDMVMDPHAMQFLANSMRNKHMSTGYVSCKSKSWHPLALYQQVEYIQLQAVFRMMENYLGGISCCPGAMTMVRFDTLLRVGPTYFGKLPHVKILDYHRFALGEDRFLTYLVLKNSPTGGTGVVINAKASTPPLLNLNGFVQQRRRWLLGTFTNEAAMIMSRQLWLKVPLLLIWRVMEFCNRFISSYIFIFILFFALGIATNVNALIFYAMPFLLQWLFLSIYAIKFKEWTAIPMFLVLLLVTPVLHSIVYVFTIRHYLKRSWGGPRTDQDDDDEVEYDDLNDLLLVKS